jgi:flagellar biogenesis protein FliO
MFGYGTHSLVVRFAPAAALQGGEGINFAATLLQTLLVLAFVCALAYLIFRRVLPRLGVGHAGNSMVRVVDVVGLDARKRLYVVEVAGRWLLLASSEAGVHLVGELDAERAGAAERALEERAGLGWKGVGTSVRATFAERLERWRRR